MIMPWAYTEINHLTLSNWKNNKTICKKDETGKVEKLLKFKHNDIWVRHEIYMWIKDFFFCNDI